MTKTKHERRARQWIERGIFRDGERYGISYAARFDNGAIKRKRELLDPSVRTLGAARKALRAARADTERGRLTHRSAKSQTFEAFAGEYLRGRERDIPASIERCRNAVDAACKVFGGVPIDKIEPRHLQAFKTRRLETVAPGTVKRDLTVLHALFRAAVRIYKVRSDNPSDDVRVAKYQEKPRRVLTLDEEQRLLNAAAPHLRPFVTIAIATGMRLGELRRLEWRDVDFSQSYVTLRETKSRRAETVPLNADARAELASLRGPGRVGPVFLYKNRPLGNPRLGLLAAARRAGIEGFTVHALRHTAATRALRSGAAIDEVQRLLRHASIVTTMRYVHNANARNAADAIATFSESGPEVAHAEKEERDATA